MTEAVYFAANKSALQCATPDVALRDLDRKALYSAVGHAPLLRWREGKDGAHPEATASQRGGI